MYQLCVPSSPTWGAMLDSRKPPASLFEPPTLTQRIISSPFRFLAQTLYALQNSLRRQVTSLSPEEPPIRVLCISDTHCLKPASLPPADLLIHAGDLSNKGTVDEIQDQLDWLKGLDYKHKIIIAGNHDSYFDPKSRKLEDKDRKLDWGNEEDALVYLQDSSTTLTFHNGERQLKLYGAPQIPACGGSAFAFQYPRDLDGWTDTVPADIDILITHTPPKRHLDLPIGLGCEWLLREVWRIRPKLHVFGHIHYGHGQEQIYWDGAQRTYERLCDRKGSSVLGNLVNVFAWFDLTKLAAHGILGLLWSQVWGGNDESTLMVNAALMVGSTGTLGNPPQVVEI